MVISYRVDVRGRVGVVSQRHGSFLVKATLIEEKATLDSQPAPCWLSSLRLPPGAVGQLPQQSKSMAARNLTLCVTIRRAESTGEDPIYTCATDEDTAPRPPPRWDESTAPPARRRRAGDGPEAARRAGGGARRRSRGRGAAIGGAEIGKRRGARANIFRPPPPGLCRRAPPARKPPGGQVDMHLAPSRATWPRRPATPRLCSARHRLSGILSAMCEL